MSSTAFEAFLTRLYVDPEARARFLENPRAEAAGGGLSEEDCAALEKIDRVGLELASRSFARKRQSAGKRGRLESFRLLFRVKSLRWK